MDIVIPVKRSYINEELRYTLRSICANMPDHKIWLVGYKPAWLIGDNLNLIEVKSVDGTKYQKVAASHLATVNHPKVSDDYLLFNDDMFIMKPVKKFTDYHCGPITDSIVRRAAKHGNSFYLKSLITTYNILRRMGFDNPMDYGLHIPITYNKEKWLRAWEEQRKINPKGLVVHMRTIYGNMYDLADKRMDDVKILENDQKPTGKEVFLSSDDDSFTQGEIGRYVREYFTKPCKCEGNVSNTFVLQ